MSEVPEHLRPFIIPDRTPDFERHLKMAAIARKETAPNAGEDVHVKSEVNVSPEMKFVLVDEFGRKTPDATPTHDRLVAMRTELIRFCHSNGWTPEQVVDRADIYLDFILNGLKKESIIND